MTSTTGCAGGVVGARRQQAGLGERGDHRVDLVLLARAGDQLGPGGATAGVLGALAGLGEAQQHAAGDGLALGAHAAVDRVGAAGQGPLDPARGGVGLEGQRPAAAALPDLEQQVLHQREGPGAVGDVGEDAAREPGLELEAGPLGRLLDGPAQAARVQRAEQHLLGGDERAQLGVLGQAAVEVGTHRDHDHRAPAGDAGRVHQVAEEGRALALVGAEGEGLLELVDDHEDALVVRAAVERPRDGQVEAALVGSEVGGARRARARAGGAAGRRAPRAGAGRAPGSARARTRRPGSAPRRIAGTSPAATTRALAAARGAEDGQEAGRAQPLDQARDVLLAAEEEVGVLLAEGLEARGRGTRRPAPGPGPARRRRRAARG